MTTVSAVQAEIEDRLEQHLDALSRGDLDAALQLFAPDAVVTPANVEPVRGLVALRGFFARESAEIAYRNAEFFTEELYLYDSQAFHFGTYKVRPAPYGGSGIQKGSFAIIWKRHRNGAWRCHRAIMNTTLPEGDRNALQ